MFAALLVVFREVLEAALVITIVMAATRGVKRRSAFVCYGIAAGAAGAIALASFTTLIAASLNGNGQDVLNAAILLTAAIMLSGHVIWMGNHGKAMAAELRAVGEDIRMGRKSLTALSVIVGMAVLREGSEIVLFLEGLFASDHQIVPLMSGGALGLLAGCAAGTVLYFGLAKLPLKTVFQSTNILLCLIAAGMAARAANFLVQAGWLSDLSPPLWNTENIVSESSVTGKLLATLVGYVSEPTGIQLIFYVATLALIVTLTKWQGRVHAPSNQPRLKTA